MDGDRSRASFEEFAAARWMALVRVAYLLTAHRQDAEDLLSRRWSAWHCARR